MSDETARLTYRDKTVDLRVVHGTDADAGLDISKLRAQTGLITVDPGYANTGANTSAITYLDGERGILRYRGYPIEDLAQGSSFLEVAYLLIYGSLPRRDELDLFVDQIIHHTLINEEMRPFFDSFPRDAHPMAVLSAATRALATFYQDSLDPFNAEHVEISIRRLLAKIPTIAAWAYKKSIGQPYVYPQNELGYVPNFLHMMFAVPAEPYTVEPVVAEALELLLILQADKEQNFYAATIRMVGSTHAILFASIDDGIDALSDQLHGGANQEVVEMLEEIVAYGGDVAKYVARAKDPSHSFRLMGFGHRIYRNFDPRATLIKAAADRVLETLGADEALFEVAQRLEEVALSDDYFVERRLYPNVDFYSGLIYRAIGFPKEMFTALFAMGRLPGWIAQWKEMIESPETRIGRPRQIYTGEPLRKYVPVDAR